MWHIGKVGTRKVGKRYAGNVTLPVSMSNCVATTVGSVGEHLISDIRTNWKLDKGFSVLSCQIRASVWRPQCQAGQHSITPHPGPVASAAEGGSGSGVIPLMFPV